MSPRHCLIHKYKRIVSPKSKNIIFKCVKCPHYVLDFQVLGREAECWYCGKTFTMSPKSLLLKPHCGCKSKDYGKNLNSKIPPKKIDDSDRDELINYLLSKTVGVKE